MLWALTPTWMIPVFTPPRSVASMWSTCSKMMTISLQVCHRSLHPHFLSDVSCTCLDMPELLPVSDDEGSNGQSHSTLAVFGSNGNESDSDHEDTGDNGVSCFFACPTLIEVGLTHPTDAGAFARPRHPQREAYSSWQSCSVRLHSPHRQARQRREGSSTHPHSHSRCVPCRSVRRCLPRHQPCCREGQWPGRRHFPRRL